MKRTALILVMLAVTGCGGRWSHIRVHDVLPTGKLAVPQRFERDYKLGVKKTAYIGQEIFRVKTYGDGEIVKAVVFPQDLAVKAKYKFTRYEIDEKKDAQIKVSQCVQFDKESWETNTGNTYYLVPLNGDDNTKWGLLISGDGILHPLGIYNYYHGMIYISPNTQSTPTIFKFETMTEVPAGSYELIFSGKNDVSINATYREYTPDNYAKPAFYQNLTYQADARQIRFKEFSIEIHEISNEKITYSIIEDGTQK